jgi:hypothetical protein
LTSESNRISAASNAFVDSVCRAWGWAWSETGQADDDGFDGLVYLKVMEKNLNKPIDRRFWKHRFTGGLINVQVKSGSSYVVSETEEFLEIKISNLDAKKEIWSKSDIPVALIYVRETPIGKSPSKAWWTDLRSNDSYTNNGTVLIQIKNRFQPGLECRKPLARLASRQQQLLTLEEVDMTSKEKQVNVLNQLSVSPKKAAWEFYHQWKLTGAKNPYLGDVIINRTGWAHITRVERPISRIKASFELLPAAAQIIREVTSWRVLRRGSKERVFKDGSKAEYEYLGLSALVKWPSRAPSEVMVILRRQTIIEGDTFVESMTNKLRLKSRKTWFYTVYEPGRGRKK